MASWLAIDWDQDQFHVLCAHSARRGVVVTRAVTWTHPEPFTPSTAERVGKALREFLKTEKIAPAPVLVGIGRDRVFLKELRFPALAAHEEANLVRFQTGKEMAESVEHYAIDYAQLPGQGSDRQVVTVAARRDIASMLKALCESAGLKLHAITPRVFGLPYVLERALAPAASPLQLKRLNIVLNLGQRWAELCFFRGDRLLQAQALAKGPLLASEIKRNLAVFQAQSAVNLDLEGPDALYVFGDDPTAVHNLQAGQSLPIRVLDPLKGDADATKDPALFAGAVALAALWSQSGPAPVNLAAPKRPQPPRTISWRTGLLAGAAAVVLLVLAIGAMSHVLSSKKAKLVELAKEKAETEKTLKQFSQARAELDAYREWENTTVPWLDEMYDLTARFPDAVGFRINQFAGSSATRGAKKDSSGYVGTIKLNGIAPAGKESLVYQLQGTMAEDKHLRADGKGLKAGVGAKSALNFQMRIDIAKQGPLSYKTVLEVPRRRVAPPAPAPEKKKEEPMAEGEDQ